MMLESCIVTLANIGFHSKSGESNPKKRALRVELSHQIDSVAVRQSQVADEHIKLRGGA